MMRKIWFVPAALAALGIATPASAADLAARPYTKAPPAPIAMVYDWSGFYIGGNAGWGNARACLNFIDAFGNTFAEGCRSGSGGLVGGQIGYRWQTGGGWVFGVEGQGDWANLRASRASLINPAFTERAKVDGIGLITGQIGYAWNNALFYVKGGGAVTGSRFDILNFTGTSVASVSATRWGAAVGVGFEYGFTPNWTVGVEYDHLFMGNRNNTFSVVNPIVAAAINDRLKLDVDMVAVRFNYKFGGYGAPVAARY
jgi:outer membrane immunogenic protein